MPLCDGCAAQTDDAHIRHRIERLELATRYRPVHIAALLIDAGPPARLEDYFYRPGADRNDRSRESRTYFDAIMKTANIDPAAHANEESALTEFQRRGFFLVGAIDCASPDPAAIERNSATLLRRVRVSYQPKSIVLFSPLTAPLIPHFQHQASSAALILDDGKPFALPTEELAKTLGQLRNPVPF